MNIDLDKLFKKYQVKCDLDKDENVLYRYINLLKILRDDFDISEPYEEMYEKGLKLKESIKLKDNINFKKMYDPGKNYSGIQLDINYLYIDFCDKHELDNCYDLNISITLWYKNEFGDVERQTSYFELDIDRGMDHAIFANTMLCDGNFTLSFIIELVDLICEQFKLSEDHINDKLDVYFSGDKYNYEELLSLYRKIGNDLCIMPQYHRW